jgi:hypothetical protein
MARLVPDARKIRSFRNVKAFESWFSANHDREPELLVRIFKKGSGVATLTAAEALEVALCWGWIDSIRKSLDASSYLQRYTPRRPKSTWSQINREHIARLAAAGRMIVHGRREGQTAGGTLPTHQCARPPWRQSPLTCAGRRHRANERRPFGVGGGDVAEDVTGELPSSCQRCA